MDVGHNVRVASLPYSYDESILDADVGLKTRYELKTLKLHESRTLYMPDQSRIKALVITRSSDSDDERLVA